jgi:hypothetical protein
MGIQIKGRVHSLGIPGGGRKRGGGGGCYLDQCDHIFFINVNQNKLYFPFAGPDYQVVKIVAP